MPGSSGSSPQHGADPHPVPPAPLVKPLYISKVNTVFQLALISGCIAQSWWGWPPQELLYAWGGLTGATTLASFTAYVNVYRQGKAVSKVM